MTETFIPIYQSRDFYIPDFDILIRGKELSAEERNNIIDIRYRDSINNIDSFDITVNNWDAKEQDFKYTGSRHIEPEPKPQKRDAQKSNPKEESKKETQKELRRHLFDPGQIIELRMGYRPTNPARAGSQPPTTQNSASQNSQKKHQAGPLQLMLVGVITSLTPNFPGSGQSTLKVTAQNILRKLMSKQRTFSYASKNGQGLTDSEIAQKVIDHGDLKLNNVRVKLKYDKAEGQKEPRYQHVIQNNQYDILFLIQRAHRNGYFVNLIYKEENGKDRPYLQFTPSYSKLPPSYSLKWGESLIQFQPKLTIANQVSQLTVRGWDPLYKKEIKVTVSREKLKTRGIRDQDHMRKIEKGFQEREEIIVDKPFRNAKEAKRYAESLLEENAHEFITARGSTLGTPDLRAGSIIEIQGIGPAFGGRYFVKSTTHTINSNGYTTEFEVRKEEKNDGRN
jgi:phage protein D